MSVWRSGHRSGPGWKEHRSIAHAIEEDGSKVLLEHGGDFEGSGRSGAEFFGHGARGVLKVNEKVPREFTIELHRKFHLNYVGSCT